jgi:hypothetical protein
MNEENPSIFPNVATNEDAGLSGRETQPTSSQSSLRALDRAEWEGEAEMLRRLEQEKAVLTTARIGA